MLHVRTGLGLLLAVLSPAQGLVHGLPVPPGAVAIVNGRLIPAGDYEDEMRSRYLRPGAPGHRILDALEDELLIQARAELAGIHVTDGDVEEKLKSLDQELRQASGKGLEDTLAQNGIPLATFRAKTQGVVLLEALCRREMQIPAAEPVRPIHQRAWIQQARETARILRDPAALPGDAVSLVDGRPVRRRAFADQMLLTLDATELRRLVETLLQEALVRQLLEAEQLVITPEAVRQEFADESTRFEKESGGVPFEELIRQQTGLDAATFQATRGFQVKAALRVLSHKWFDAEALEREYPSREGYFGPLTHVRHVFLAASDRPEDKGKAATFAAARLRMDVVLADHARGIAFPDLVTKYSEDLATKFQGGLLPPFAPRRHPYDQGFAEAALSLGVGQVSSPVRSSMGWHLLRCERRDPVPPLAAVEGELRRLLAAERFKAAFEAAAIGVQVPPR
jgi:parvulin-like peptidyl-prolyl isomerase